jgi:GH15 family glucan-1,4-alpha-glucosidase
MLASATHGHLARAQPSSRYRPIADYGIIGDMRSAALVSVDGSIDWCCFPRFDSASLFAALLDPDLGGRFRIAPSEPHTARQRYLPRTNILVTSFHAYRRAGVVDVTDFMPVPSEAASILAPHEIHRRIRCLSGEVDLEIEFTPRFDYGRSDVRLIRGPHGIVALGTTEEAVLAAPESLPWEIDEEKGIACGRVTVREGDVLWLVLRYDSRDPAPIDSYRSAAALDATVDFWHGWVCPISYDGPYRSEVERSALALKLLFYTPTGAVVAAPTTSLPEALGGSRNWDYRYNWIRDAAFTLSAFHILGHRYEAERYMQYLRWVASKSEHLQIVYGIGGETQLEECELTHLAGYRGARPVRVGNGAFRQLQLDVYGELLDAAFLWHREHMVSEDLGRLLVKLANTVAERWREPDHGIWEIRREPRHYVHSKVMCWVALDRALRMTGGEGPDARRWRQERDAIHAEVMERGWSDRLRAFVQSYDSEALDAANLLIPVVGFLDGRDPRVCSTIQTTLDHLARDGVLYRYLDDDGLPGAEGVFGICSFWLADALILAGELEHGERVFKRMLGWANRLGLYSEELDPRTGDFLGNFPQAFTHIALINTAHLLENARGGRVRNDPKART